MSKVGKRILHLEDRHRRDWRNEGARPLLTELWYPATENSPTAPFVFGSPEPLFYFPPISINGDLHSEDEAYPLVVMSHGTGGSALQMGWLARHLAAHGYVAAAVFLLAPALGMGFSEPGLADVDVPVHIVVPESDSEVPPGTNGRRFGELMRARSLEKTPMAPLSRAQAATRGSSPSPGTGAW